MRKLRRGNTAAAKQKKVLRSHVLQHTTGIRGLRDAWVRSQHIGAVNLCARACVWRRGVRVTRQQSVLPSRSACHDAGATHAGPGAMRVVPVPQ